MKKMLVALFVILMVMEAKADITGNRLIEYCRFYPRQTQATALCLGYISATLDTYRLFQRSMKLNTVCEPPGVTGEQLISMAIKYLADNPSELHNQAASIIVEMYEKAFHCPK